MIRTLLVVLFALALPAASAAKQPASDAPRRSPKVKAPPPPQPKDSGLDFDLLGPDSKAEEQKPDPKIEEAVKLRRGMLLFHQGLGIATWVSLAATDVVGQLELSDKYGGGGDSGRYQLPHAALAITTSVLFASVGTLGLLAPTPYKKPFRLDTAGLHKIAMGIATAGMVAQLVLGVLAASREGQLDQRAFAQAHQIIGYATLGAMTCGATVLVF